MRTHPHHRRRAPSVHGFSLIEALVAMAVMAVAVLMLATIVGHEPRAIGRLDAHREAYGVLFGALESVRAGTLSPAELEDADPATWLPSSPAARNVRLESETTSFGRPGLLQLRLRVFYDTAGARTSRTVETLLWRPPT